jgi:hypothetical protein
MKGIVRHQAAHQVSVLNFRWQSNPTPDTFSKILMAVFW